MRTLTGWPLRARPASTAGSEGRPHSPAPRAGRRGGSSEARVEARARAEAKPGRPGAGRAHMGPAGRGAHGYGAYRLSPADRRLGTGSGRGRRSGHSKMAVAAAGRAHAGGGASCGGSRSQRGGAYRWAGAIGGRGPWWAGPRGVRRARLRPPLVLLRYRKISARA